MPHTYGIRAHADPQALMRIVGLFAQRSIIPDQVSCRLAGEYLVIDIQAMVGGDADAHILLYKIREQVCVDRANLVDGAAHDG